MLNEVLAFGFSAFFGFVYAVAFWRNSASILQVWPGVIGLVGLPLLLAIAHRTVRLERSKGADALYRKCLQNGG